MGYIESTNKEILGFNISKERNMFVVADVFLSDIADKYGQYPVSNRWWTWFPQGCKFLKFNHHLHSSL